MITISVGLEGAEEFVNHLDTREKHAENLSVPFAKIGAMLMKSFDINFVSFGALFQLGGWKAPAHDYGHPLMQDKGVMRRSFQSRTGKDRAEFWNLAPYFKYHQSNQPRKRLPRRIMLGIDETHRRKIVRTIQQYVMKGGN
jgi:phage gpG-like protein